MASKLESKILARHLAEQKMLSKVISSIFEEVTPLKLRKELDNPQIFEFYSLVMKTAGGKHELSELNNPFKSKTLTMADHPEVKAAQKGLKTAVMTANKAAGAMKSVDLTNVSDVADKVSALMSSIVKVHDLENEVANMEDVEPQEVLTPELKKAIGTVYGLVAYNLNAVKSLIDRHVKNLERSVSPEVLRAAAAHAQDSEMGQMQKKIMNPWHKQLAGMIGGASHASAAPMPGGMRLREDDEEEQPDENSADQGNLDVGVHDEDEDEEVEEHQMVGTTEE